MTAANTETKTLQLPLVPMDCPRFENCNAAVCPLGDGWDKAAHLPGEPVCYYLRNSGKAGAGERFALDPVFRACLGRLPLVAARYPQIGRAVEKAARSPMKAGRFARKAPVQHV